MSTSEGRTFKVYAPLSFFEKADAPKGQSKRIAGVVSTELKDKQRELLLQRGLDFSPFIQSGWFNDNHSKVTTDILGYPTDVKKFQKGDRLPDGASASANCTWTEGYLLDTPQAQKVWDLGVALAKAGSDRRLGFSIEGQVLERTGPAKEVVAKAVVRNVAVTNCPVSEDTRMEVLAKSLEDAEKALTAGSPVAPGTNVAEAGPLQGEGAGTILEPQHLEEKEKKVPKKDADGDFDGDEDDKKEVSKSAAIGIIQQRLNCHKSTAERAYRAILNFTGVAMAKEGIKQPELEKGLKALEAAASTPNRRQELFQKAEAGKISAEEREELVKSISGESTLASSATAPLRTDSIQKSLDVSDFLREQHQGLTSSLEVLASALEKSDSDNREFRVALAQGMVELAGMVTGQAEVIKSMQADLAKMGGQPSRAPRSQVAVAAASTGQMAKSFAGRDSNALSKSQIQDGLDDMVQKGLQVVAGEDVMRAATKYESTNMISQGLLAEVQRHLAQGSHAA